MIRVPKDEVDPEVFDSMVPGRVYASPCPCENPACVVQELTCRPVKDPDHIYRIGRGEWTPGETALLAALLTILRSDDRVAHMAVTSALVAHDPDMRDGCSPLDAEKRRKMN